MCICTQHMNQYGWNLCVQACVTSQFLHYHYRFSRPFSSPLHSISSIFKSISSSEAHCVQILSSISSTCHSYLFFVHQIQIHQLSLKFISAAKQVRNAWIKFVTFSNKLIILSFKFVKCYMGLYIWETIWVKLRQKWMPIDEIYYVVSCSATVTDGWQSTKLNDVSKLINQKRNWKHFFFLLNEEVTKMGRKTYTTPELFNFPQISLTNPKFPEISRISGKVETLQNTINNQTCLQTNLLSFCASHPHFMTCNYEDIPELADYSWGNSCCVFWSTPRCCSSQWPASASSCRTSVPGWLSHLPWPIHNSPWSSCTPLVT